MIPIGLTESVLKTPAVGQTLAFVQFHLEYMSGWLCVQMLNHIEERDSDSVGGIWSPWKSIDASSPITRSLQIILKGQSLSQRL